MELLSINVSLPVEIEIENEGKVVTTGIFKQPINGSIYIYKHNLSGDKQADLKNHGGEHKAVYGYAFEHYAYWCKFLNIPELNYGKFGENLTISGLDEKKLCIGDELKIGHSVLQITQPRVPCFKLGIAFKNKQMPKLFIEKAATGIYFRVIQEGKIAAGNQCKIIKQGKHQLSVHNLFKAYYGKQFDNPKSVFATALDIPELSSEWRKKITGKNSL